MTARLTALAILDGALLIGAVLGLSVVWTLLAHAALTAFAFAIWLRGGRAIGFAPAILGMLGPIAILAALPLGRMAARRHASGFDLPFLPSVPVVQTGASLRVARMLDGRVHHAEPETLHSFVTIMRHGDVGARRRALETVVRSFQPALSPLIALALTDADQTIRALAAAAAARVGQNLAMTRAALETRTLDGDDPKAAATLAALLADHARSDVLLSDSQRANLREDAVAIQRTVPAGAAAYDAMTIEALWAAGDYDAIDRLAAAMVPSPAHRGAAAIAAWWRTESAV